MDERENNSQEEKGIEYGYRQEEEKTASPEDETKNIKYTENIVKTENTGTAVPVVKADKGGFSIKKITVVLCLVCALLGGMTGGAASGLIVMSSKNEKEATAETTVEQENNLIEANAENNTTQSAAETTVKSDTGEDFIQSGTASSLADKPSADETLTPKEIYANNVETVVSIEAATSYGTSAGTGFIISEQGYIVTNYHVVEGSKNIQVALYDNSVYTAELVGYEDTNDLAVLKIEPRGTIKSVVYGKSSDLSVGDYVYIIGNPLGDLTFTLTAGVVSALNRLIDVDDGVSINMFQTDAAVNSGNSGGPVFDEHGYVVGIASAKYASASIEGLSFCIPIDDVRSMIDDIINNGYVSGKASMGVSVYDSVTENYGFFQSTRKIDGAKIAAVGSSTAASRAGLSKDDIITAVDGNDISSVSSLKTVLASYRSGDTVTVTFLRNGSEKKVTLTFDEYAPSSPRTDYSNVYDL